MKLSILILTHNRPKLFTRCLESVLYQINSDVEVIVNNDSKDIVEILHPQVRYYYNKFNSLCEIYKFLLEQSQGEYVYFLEDDDYLNKNFFEITLEEDLIVGNYYPTYNPNNILEFLKLYKDQQFNAEEFIKQLNYEHLQLSQHIFKRDSIIDFEFTMDNNIHNDIRLVLHATQKSKIIKTTNKILYFQTTDGGDNISFPDSKHEVNINKSLKFLENYELHTPTSYTTRS